MISKRPASTDHRAGRADAGVFGAGEFAFGLAQMFNGYHRYPILNEEQADARLWRAAGVAYVRAQLTRALDLMGIAVPPRM
jgi:arginyl-tRNA synthetase